MRVILSFAILGLTTLGWFSTAHAAKKALVIGNNAYDYVTRLERAVPDAWAIGDTLEKVGFEVTRHANLRRRDFSIAIGTFAEGLESGDEVVFFYGGHGVAIDGDNYLLPTDIPLDAPGGETFVKSESFSLSEILAAIRARKAALSVMIINACRNNPFKVEGQRTLGETRGLLPVLAPEGTFIMYSAGVGQTALDSLGPDDLNPNSVFARSLIPMLREPGLSLPRLARGVRQKVMDLAARISHEQRPAYYDELVGDFFISGKAGGAAATRSPAAAASPAQPLDVGEFRTVPWDRVYGNGVSDKVVDEEGRIFLAGTGDSPVPCGGSMCANFYGRIARLDTAGNLIWEKRFDTRGHGSMIVAALNYEGNIAAAGLSDSKVRFVEVSPEGDELSSVTYGHEGYSYIPSSVSRLDTMVLVAGHKRRHGSNETTPFVVAFERKGKVAWERSFSHDTANADVIVQALPNSDVLIASSLRSKTFSYYSRHDPWFARLTASGRVRWERRAEKEAKVANLTVYPDGRVFIVGTTWTRGSGGSDIWVGQLDAGNGNIKQELLFGGSGYEEGRDIEFVTRARNKHLVITGSTTSKGAGSSDAWVFEIARFSSQIVQERLLGGRGPDSADSIDRLPDGGLVVSGTKDGKGWMAALPAAADQRDAHLRRYEGRCVDGFGWISSFELASNTGAGSGRVSYYRCNVDYDDAPIRMFCSSDDQKVFGLAHGAGAGDTKLSISAAGRKFRISGTTEYNEMDGFYFVNFEHPAEPLLSTLASAQSATLRIGKKKQIIHLRDFGAALDVMRRGCPQLAARAPKRRTAALQGEDAGGSTRSDAQSAAATAAALDPAAATTRSLDTGGGWLTLANHAFEGRDIATLPKVARERCEQACAADARCKGFLYDKWNRWCFLKDGIATPYLHPKYDVAAKRSAVPSGNFIRSTAPRGITLYRRKHFPGATGSRTSASSLDGCGRTCLINESCVAFSYKRRGPRNQRCLLMSEAGEYFTDRSGRTDSGIITQTSR